MNVKKLFSTVFNEEMQKRGFKLKGRVFYRMVGEMLQGVTIKPLKNYSLHFISYPYWSYSWDACSAVESTGYAKGYWAEAGLELSPCLSAYYREVNAEMNLDYMNACLEIASEQILPIIDKIDSIDTFLSYREYNWINLPEELRNKRCVQLQRNDILEKYGDYHGEFTLRWDDKVSRVHQYAYLYKAYQDGSFDRAYRLLSHTIEDCSAEYQKRLSSLFVEKMQSGDLEWIEQYRQSRKEQLVPRFKKELGLDISSI